MELEIMPYDLTVCKVKDVKAVNTDAEFFFLGRTDEEISLVCVTADTPDETVEREDGWRGFRIVGTLDFSLVGILSKISAVLADNGIGIFAVSTYNTDYILVRADDLDKAEAALSKQGYVFI